MGVAQQNVFKIGFLGGAVTLDPTGRREITTLAWQSHIYEPLTSVNRRGQVVPALALSWKNTSPTTWVFNLRPKIHFHDGSSFSSQDVIFSIERARDNPKSQMREDVAGIVALHALGALQIEIVTSTPVPLLPQRLVGLAMLPAKYAKAGGDEWFLKPNGTGPYKFVSWLSEDNLVLSANENYWQKPASLKNIVLQNISNNAARVAALLSGQVQLIDKVPPQDMARLGQSNNLHLSSVPGNRIIYLGLDYRQENSPAINTGAGFGVGPNPLAKTSVRRAIAAAIDKQLIADTIMGGLATPATQFVAPSVNYYDTGLKGIAYNPEVSKKLLNDAGYAGGFELRLDAPNDRYLNDALVAQAVAGMLEKINVRVRVNAISKTVLFPQLDKGDFSMFLSGWASSDMVGTLLSQVVCKNKDKGVGTFNRVGYCNETVDKFAALASSTFSDKERKNALSRAARQALQDDVIWIPLYSEKATTAIDAHYTYTTRGDEFINAYDIK